MLVATGAPAAPRLAAPAKGGRVEGWPAATPGRRGGGWPLASPAPCVGASCSAGTLEHTPLLPRLRLCLGDGLGESESSQRSTRSTTSAGRLLMVHELRGLSRRATQAGFAVLQPAAAARRRKLLNISLPGFQALEVLRSRGGFRPPIRPCNAPDCARDRAALAVAQPVPAAEIRGCRYVILQLHQPMRQSTSQEKQLTCIRLIDPHPLSYMCSRWLPAVPQEALPCQVRLPHAPMPSMAKYSRRCWLASGCPCGAPAAC